MHKLETVAPQLSNKIMTPNKISNYEIQELIIKSNTARVYRATHIPLAREVILKVRPIKLDVINENVNIAKRLLSEARVSANLEHNHIINIYDTGRDNNLWYTSMEYCPLGSLRAQLDQGKQFPTKWAIDIALQLLSALKYTHNRGYIHRDIKPENILFRTHSHVVLTDFGISKKKNHNNHITLPNVFPDSTHYIAPEQALDNQADIRSDLYSLGVVFYELIIGEITYDESKSYQKNFDTLQHSISEIKGELEIFRPIFNKLLAKNPDNRFQKAELIINKLQDLKNTLTENEIRLYEERLPKRKPIKKYKITLVASFFSLLFIPAFAVDENQPPPFTHNINISKNITTTIYKNHLDQKTADNIDQKYENEKIILTVDLPDEKTNAVTTVKLTEIVPIIATPAEPPPSTKMNSAPNMDCILKINGCKENKTGTPPQQPVTPASSPKEPTNEKIHHTIQKTDISCILKLKKCVK